MFGVHAEIGLAEIKLVNNVGNWEGMANVNLLVHCSLSITPQGNSVSSSLQAIEQVIMFRSN